MSAVSQKGFWMQRGNEVVLSRAFAIRYRTRLAHNAPLVAAMDIRPSISVYNEEEKIKNHLVVLSGTKKTLCEVFCHERTFKRFT